MRNFVACLVSASLILGGCAHISASDKKILAGVGAVAVGAGAMIAVTEHQKTVEHNSHMASTCGDTPSETATADRVFIGPDLWDGPHSVGMPLHPTADPRGGFYIDLPYSAPNKLDYVTWRYAGPLTNKTKIVIEYELSPADAVVEAPPQPQLGDNPDAHYRARITTYFQQIGDDWSATGKFEPARWYYDQTPDLHYLEPGAHVLEAPLAGPGWGATQTSTFENNPTAFAAAKANVGCLGFVLGGNGIGIGHGATAKAPARLWVKSIRIE